MYLNKKITLIIFILLAISISAQLKGRPNKDSFPRSVGIETHIVPSDTLFTCFISFKIGFENLVFVKDKGIFHSGITFSIDIIHKEKIFDRVIKNSSAFVDEYEVTKSNELFLEDVVSIKIPKGDYLLNPVISINNTDIEVKLKPLEVKVDSTNLSYPITVFKDKVNYTDRELFKLLNSENSIPYSSNQYDLLIPIFDQSINSIDVEIWQRGRTVLKNSIVDYGKINFKLDTYKNQIIIVTDETYPIVKLFKIPYTNKKLDEGMAKIIVKYEDVIEQHDIKVLWNGKPRSLRDSESAIEMLKIIGKKAQADSLLDEPEDEYGQVLSDYWRKFDNDTSTTFNEVYSEFYTRIDHANEVYKTLNGSPGALSDRGIVYVKYGEPDSAVRSYNENYNIIEIWEYKSIGMKIYFSDKTGTGEFKRFK